MKQLDSERTADRLTDFIGQTVKTAGFSHVVVAVSGGVDSATSLLLAARALGPEYVYTLLLPYKNWHETAKKDAQLVINQLHIPKNHQFTQNITVPVDALVDQLHLSDKPRIGNIMARMRMITLFDYAKKLNALVLGTENKSEHYLGYFTRFGDEASDIEPLRYLYKTQVYELAAYLGVPKEILVKAPTAGLWQGQTDESELGFTYKEADGVMWGLLDQGKSEKDLVKDGFNPAMVQKVTRWMKKVSFKHHLPSLGPQPLYTS